MIISTVSVQHPVEHFLHQRAAARVSVVTQRNGDSDLRWAILCDKRLLAGRLWHLRLLPVAAGDRQEEASVLNVTAHIITRSRVRLPAPGTPRSAVLHGQAGRGHLSCFCPGFSQRCRVLTCSAGGRGGSRLLAWTRI